MARINTQDEEDKYKIWQESYGLILPILLILYILILTIYKNNLIRYCLILPLLRQFGKCYSEPVELLNAATKSPAGGFRGR
jgi:hypothetical protein